MAQYALHNSEGCGAAGTCSHLSSLNLWPIDKNSVLMFVLYGLILLFFKIICTSETVSHTNIRFRCEGSCL